VTWREEGRQQEQAWGDKCWAWDWFVVEREMDGESFVVLSSCWQSLWRRRGLFRVRLWLCRSPILRSLV
jgi:hypothetical protein